MEPLILFGAFDRHNLGDLLFPHLLSRLLGWRSCRFAGLVARDLRPWGGHKVEALAALACHWGNRPARLIHVGGELLGCDAWEAAVMSLSPDEAIRTIDRYHRRAEAQRAWARGQLGVPDQVPYMADPALFEQAEPFLYQSVGGVALPNRAPAFQAEVRRKLARAGRVSVRDTVTLSSLQQAGIPAMLAPDLAVLVGRLFGERIAREGRMGEPSLLRRCWPKGYLALQFSADFGDDATLAQLADQLSMLVHGRGLGLVLFRAGAAPWHDDLEVYRRLMRHLPGMPVHLFASLNLWQLCAMLAGANGYCGSSLHGRILASALGVPGISLVADAVAMSKQRAYLETWHRDQMGLCSVTDLADSLHGALAMPARTLQAKADELASLAWQDVAASLAVWGLEPACPLEAGGP